MRALARRNTELLLLFAAAPIVILLYAMYVINTGADISFRTLAVPIGLAAAFAIAHLAIRFLAPAADSAILPVVFLLSGIGITFVTRLAPELAIRQVMWLFLSIAAMISVLIVVRNLERLARYRYTIVIIGLVLLLMPIFIGAERGGSKLWIDVGTLFSFQPGELAKVFIVLFLAAYLSQNREALAISNIKILGIALPPFRMLLPLLIMWLITMGIVVFERDLGSALLFYGIFLIMLYTATGRWTYVLIGLLLLAFGGFMAYELFSHVQIRFQIWLDPFKDPSGAGLQIVQSLYSLADGGLIGSGIGRGLPTKIPIVESDFIFSAIAEEMGLLGGAAVLLLYIVFAIRGFLTAARAKSDMAAFTAVGLTSAISLQAFIIVGGVTKFIPLTGVTLPFMSQGGTSLFTSFIIVALLLRAGDSGTGVESELEGDGLSDKDRAASGSHSLNESLKTPESGVLGRVALGRRLTVLVTFFAVIFALLIANLTWIQVVKAEELRNMPSNNHTMTKANLVERGSIITSDGVTLAESIQSNEGVYTRSYPAGSLASHVVGYISDRYGSAGIEAQQNDTLTGHANFSTWEGALNALSGKTPPGNDVMLTINSQIQRAAQRSMQGVKGAVVVIDPRTGAILAMVSTPSYDNSQIVELLNSSGKSDVLFNRATQALYAPGSTFKVVTMAAALDSGTATGDSVYNGRSPIEIGGAKVTNFGNSSWGDITLRKALEDSVNTVFAQVGNELGPDLLVEYSKRFGYGSAIGKGINSTASLMPDPAEMTEWETAWASVGQPVGQHKSPAGPQTTIIQNAVVAATIANNGVVMEPYIVDKVLSPEGEVLSSSSPRTIGKALSINANETLRESMLAVIKSGTGRQARIDGVQVAGKTGTAETNNKRADSHFIGFAPYDSPTVAVAVVVEQANDRSAAKVAQQVMKATLIAQGVIK